MPIKIGINGMGRIGRMVVRSIYENYKGKIQIKHINNRSGSEICANLLKYDSVHGKFNAEIKSNSNYLRINKDKISFSQFSNIQGVAIWSLTQTQTSFKVITVLVGLIWANETSFSNIKQRR